MVSFRDGCHTGGIFIAEGFTTIASYCSQAGITFLNSTSETGGILFGSNPLVLILKGYSWFANIQLKISIIYDNCAGITNICDKFRLNSPMFPGKCGISDDVPCRHVIPTPCIEIVRLPSDGLRNYSTECAMLSHVDRSPLFAYIQFANSLLMTFAIKGNLDFQEVFPLIFVEYVENNIYFPFLLSRLQLNMNYSLLAPSIITNIKNTFPWLGIGHWIRLTQDLGCRKEDINLQPLESLQIERGCGELGLTSVTGHAKLSIHRSVFVDSHYLGAFYQCLHVAIFLVKGEEVSKYSAEGLFNATLQFSVGSLLKQIVYSKRQYLEIKLFSQYPKHVFSMDLKWGSSLDGLQILYIRRPEQIADQRYYKREHTFDASWIAVEEPEVCFRGISCYKYHESHDVKSDVTWNTAQAQCAEQNTNLVSINSPEEWHFLRWWAYNFNWTKTNGAVEEFKGRLLFIGQWRIDVSNCVDFYAFNVDKNINYIV